jgi:uncharacterized protein
MLKIITNTEDFVRKRLANEGTGHDWWHIERVYKTAKKLHAKEGGDWTVIALATLLHDVGDRKVLGTAEDDYTIANNFLREQNVSE